MVEAKTQSETESGEKKTDEEDATTKGKTRKITRKFPSSATKVSVK